MVIVNYRICLVKIGYGSRINFMWDNLSKDAYARFYNLQGIKMQRC